MSTYSATIRWWRKPDESFLDGDTAARIVGGSTAGRSLPPPSSPSVVRIPFSDPAGVDPEEALVAALSSCHMLFFLDFAKQASSSSSLRGRRRGRGGEGRGRTGAHDPRHLRPLIGFGGSASRRAELAAIHHRAHEACYIANSVTAEVRVEGAAEGLRG